MHCSYAMFVAMLVIKHFEHRGYILPHGPSGYFCAVSVTGILGVKSIYAVFSSSLWPVRFCTSVFMLNRIYCGKHI